MLLYLSEFVGELIFVKFSTPFRHLSIGNIGEMKCLRGPCPRKHFISPHFHELGEKGDSGSDFANKLSFIHEIQVHPADMEGFSQIRCQRGRSPTLTPYLARTSGYFMRKRYHIGAN